MGDNIIAGDIFGKVYEGTVLHWIMLPPNKQGTIVYIAPPSFYTLEDEVLIIEFMGVNTSFIGGGLSLSGSRISDVSSDIGRV